MPRSSFNQTEFTGGEWGPQSQGRSEDPAYSTALGLCLNQIPLEEGSVTRRSGTMFIVPTHNRSFAWVLPFDGSATCSFAMEFTDNNLRFLTQSSLICDNTTVPTITGESSGVLTLSTPVAWSAGNEVMLVFPDETSSLFPYPQALEVGCRNRLLRVGLVNDSTHIYLADDLGTLLPFSGWPTGALVGAQILKVKILTSPYAGAGNLANLRAIQAETQSIVLSSTEPPYIVQITAPGTGSLDPVFAFAPAALVDGPYLDPQTNSLSLSALSGAVTATAGTATFAATDVGRAMRVFTQPPDFSLATTYNAGDQVTDANGAWWTSLLGGNVGVQPGTVTYVGGNAQVNWAPAPNAGSWAWGYITHFTDSTHVTWTIDTTIPGMVLQSTNGTTATTWELGVYTVGTYPTCGTFDRGRLWLGGAIPNRFDTSTSNGVAQATPGIIVFSPTDPYGNVLDDSGISEILNSKNINPILWMLPDDRGILMGTLSNEFIVTASEANDVITPTSIDQMTTTKYGSRFIEPVRAGMSAIFAQKYGRRLMEYLADGYTNKFSGRRLNPHSRHMSVSGIAQIAYQEEPQPIIWTRMNSGLLTGTTYRRESRFVSNPPELAAAHWHMHGGNRVFTAMCVVPGDGGLLDRLFTVTNDAPPVDPNQNSVSNYFIEVVQPTFDEGVTLEQSWNVDQAPGPGPGRSGDDCGGGQAATFQPTGQKGADSVTSPDMSLVPPFPALAAASTPTEAGIAVLNGATYFDGNAFLTGLPKINADHTSISMSVWIGYEDFPMQAGALLSSPALTGAQETAGTSIISNLVAAGNGSLRIAGSNSGASGPAAVSGTITTAVTDWLHLMISAKSNANGTITVLCYIATKTEANIANNTVASSVPSHAAMWPWATHLDSLQADIGLCAWTIGGADVLSPSFDIHVDYDFGPPLTIVVPSLVQLLKEQGVIFGNGVALNLPPSATAEQMQAALTGYSVTVPNLVSKVRLTGGSGNTPYPSPIGGYGGFRGSVAELWIQSNVFIDWTQIGNRNKFHQLDTVTGSYVPISLGKDGSTPGFGTPWVYCGGPPSFFPINRATGMRLTVASTITDIENALQLSDLNYPPT